MARGTRTRDERKDILTALEAWIAEGKTLREFCRQEGMPHYATIYDWIDDDAEYAQRIARARLIGEEVISQECLAIADTPQIGEEEKTDTDGFTEYKRGDMLGHRKLQIETRLKLLAKWNPKKWADRVDLNHGGEMNINAISKLDEGDIMSRITDKLSALGIAPSALGIDTEKHG